MADSIHKAAAESALEELRSRVKPRNTLIEEDNKEKYRQSGNIAIFFTSREGERDELIDFVRPLNWIVCQRSRQIFLIVSLLILL